MNNNEDLHTSTKELMMEMSKEDILNIAQAHLLEVNEETSKLELVEQINQILVDDFAKDSHYFLMDEFLFLIYVFLQFEEDKQSSIAVVLQSILNQYDYEIDDEDGEQIIKKGYFQILKETEESIVLRPYPQIYHYFLNNITPILTTAVKNQKMADLTVALTNIYGFYSYSQYVHIWNLYNSEDTLTEETASDFFPQIQEKGLNFYLFNKTVINDMIPMEEFRSLYENSKNLPWFIPPKEMIEQGAKTLINTDSEEYKALKLFFKHNKGNIKSKKKLEEIVDHLTLELKFDSPPSAVMEILFEKDYVFDNDITVQTFLTRYQQISDNTRKWTLKGFTPKEIQTLIT